MPAQHYVICKHCGVRFNRDKEEAVKISANRYVHKTCYDEYIKGKDKDEQDYLELEEYIKKLFNIKTLSAKIKKQIADYRKEYNYTYSGILKTLTWWFEVKGNSIDKSNGGIGIVPYVYQDAYNYYYTLYLVNFVNKLDDEDIKYNIKTKEIMVQSPRAERSPQKHFNMEKWEE